MKMTMSKDGVPRATVKIEHRISENDLELIAFVNDYNAYDNPPSFRKATRKEVVGALKSGFGQEFWKEEATNAYLDIKKGIKSDG